MEIIRAADVVALENSGVRSRQLLFPENSRSERVTITRVVMQPGTRNPAHRHAHSEQIWIALRGAGHLPLDGGQRLPFAAGDVARFEDGDVHGFENAADEEFEYISVTSPPLNFRAAYARDWAGPGRPTPPGPEQP
jgi:quercetin dioxygenase-like cupin family protein